MFCTQCGNRLGDADRFCRQCGRSTDGAPPRRPPYRGLTRDRQNKKIAGVCAGFARYLEVDVILVRVVWLALAFCTGVGFIAYLIAWIVMPNDPLGVPAPGAAFAGQRV